MLNIISNRYPGPGGRRISVLLTSSLDSRERRYNISNVGFGSAALDSWVSAVVAVGQYWWCLIVLTFDGAVVTLSDSSALVIVLSVILRGEGIRRQ